MSAFRVGQRVRIVRVSKPVNSHLVGLEARIAELMPAVSGASLDCHHLAKEGWFILLENLEPILYDGNQLVSWEECLWQPEGQAA